MNPITYETYNEMDIDDLNFTGLSEETKTSLMSNFAKFDECTAVFSDVEGYVKQKYGEKVSLGSITADMIRAARRLIDTLNVAKNEAVMDSDKEEFQEAIDNLSMLSSFTGVVGETLFDMSQDNPDMMENDDINNLIGASTV